MAGARCVDAASNPQLILLFPEWRLCNHNGTLTCPCFLRQMTLRCCVCGIAPRRRPRTAARRLLLALTSAAARGGLPARPFARAHPDACAAEAKRPFFPVELPLRLWRALTGGQRRVISGFPVAALLRCVYQPPARPRLSDRSHTASSETGKGPSRSVLQNYSSPRGLLFPYQHEGRFGNLCT